MEETLILEGSISVKAALEARKRPVLELITDDRIPDRNRSYILKLAGAAGIPVSRKTKEEISALAGGTSHGGLLARVGDRAYETAEDLFGTETPFLALLDGIEDPYNFGGALRSLYAAGVSGVLVPERNWCSAAGTVTRASAGASEFLRIAPVRDWQATLTEAKQHGIRILCAERKNASPLYEADLTGPVILVFGGEMRGISAEILRMADQNLFLPYGSEFRNALSANSAAAVFAFEAYRQRRHN